MSNNFNILTNGGFKPYRNLNADDGVFVVDPDGNVSLTYIDKWVSQRNAPTYKIYNRTIGNTIYANAASMIYAVSIFNTTKFVQQLSVNDVNDQYTGNKIYSYNRVSFKGCDVERKFEYIDLVQAVKNRRLNNSYFDNVATASNVIDLWQQYHSRLNAIDYNQGLLLQSLVTRTGYMSRLANEVGFIVKTFIDDQDTFLITDIDTVNEDRLKITVIPHDSNGNQLHLIYQLDGNTFIV